MQFEQKPWSNLWAVLMLEWLLNCPTLGWGYWAPLWSAMQCGVLWEWGVAFYVQASLMGTWLLRAFFPKKESYLSPTLIFKHIFGSWPICSLELADLREWTGSQGLKNLSTSLSELHNKDKQKLPLCSSNEMYTILLLLSDYYQFAHWQKQINAHNASTACQ